MKKVTQTVVDDVTQAFARNAIIAPGKTDVNDWRPIDSYRWVAVGGLNPIQVGRISDLASTSKILIDYVIAKLAEKHGSTKLAVTPELLAELYGRTPEEYAKQYGDQFMPQGEDAKTEIVDHFAGKTVEVGVVELRRQMLVISSNEATRILKNWVSSLLGGHEGLQQEVSKITPTVTLSITENGYHWVQGNPNSGDLSDIARFLHEVASQDFPTEWEVDWLNSLDHQFKSVDFKFCLTHSPLGTKLISEGYTIREKTGFNPICYWQKSLATLERLPFHMQMCTIVQIVPPTGLLHDIVTFALAIRVEVSQPDKWRGYDWMPEGVLFPDETDPEYADYLEEVQKVINIQFRDKMEQIWEESQKE